MLRRLISVALAMSMIAAALAAINVAAEDLTGSIVAKNDSGDTQELFFSYENLQYTLAFQVDGNPSAADFTLRLVDFAGNQMSWRAVATTSDGIYHSIGNWTWFSLWGLADGDYWMKATLDSTGQMLFSRQVSVISEKIEIEPDGDRTAYLPGEEITIMITVDYDDDVNITISPYNITWANQTVEDYMVSVDWQIPEDIETGTQTIYVNRSSDDVQLIWPAETFNIESFTVEYYADRMIGPNWWGSYLLGETVSAQWIARSVVTQEVTTIDNLEFNMTYWNAIDGTEQWLNKTYNASPFNVALPDLADINMDITVKVTAYSGNYSNELFPLWIDLAALSADIDLSPGGPYMPNEVIEVTVEAEVGTTPLPDADVEISVTDDEGTPVDFGLVATNLTTDSVGECTVIIEVPDDLEEGDYQVIATVTILDYSVMVSQQITVQDQWVIDVLTDMNAYIAGDTIEVTVSIIQNGQARESINYIEYWLSIDGEDQLPREISEDLSVQITAPEDVNSNQVRVKVAIYLDNGTEMFNRWSDQFSVYSLMVIIGASKLEYKPGDTVKFEVIVLGDADDFDFRYSIFDEDDVPIVNAQSLTIDDEGRADFELEVPEEDPSEMYLAQVIADNGEGMAIVEDLDVWMIDDDYLVEFWIETSPKYTSGAYAPGQTIVVGFEITPLKDDIPDLPVVQAAVYMMNIWDSVMWWGGGESVGELATFTDMSGEITITIPENANSGDYVLFLELNAENWGTEETQYLTVDGSASSWDRGVGGLSTAELLMLILVIIVILMLAVMMMKGRGGAAVAAAPKEEKPKKPPKEEKKDYEPKSSVKCPSCGAAIDVGTSKRPIEVMCPKCGATQMVQ